MANNYYDDPYGGQKATGGATMNGQQGSRTQASLQNADAYSKSKGDPFAAYGNLSAAWSKALGPKSMATGTSLPSAGGGSGFRPMNPDIGYGPGQVPTFAPSGGSFQPFRMPGEGAPAPAGSTRVFGEPVPQGGALQARNPFANPVANPPTTMPAPAGSGQFGDYRGTLGPVGRTPSGMGNPFANPVATPPTTFPAPGPNQWQPLDVNYYDELRKKIVGPRENLTAEGGQLRDAKAGPYPIGTTLGSATPGVPSNVPQFGDYRGGPFPNNRRMPGGMSETIPMGNDSRLPAPTNPWQPMNPGYYENMAAEQRPPIGGDPLGDRGFNPGGGNPDGLPPPTTRRPPATPSTQPPPPGRPPATPSTQPPPTTWAPVRMPGEGAPAPPGSTTPFAPPAGNPFAQPVNDPWGTTFPGPTNPNIPGATGSRTPSGMNTGPAGGGSGFAPNGQPLGSNGIGRRLTPAEDPNSASGKRSQTYQWFNKDGKQEMWETDANGKPTRKVQTGQGPGSGAQVIDFPTGGSTSQVNPTGTSTTTGTGTFGAPNNSTTFDPNVMPTSNVGDWFDPIASKALDDVRRQAMHAGSLTSDINGGGSIPGMTEELGNVANIFAAKKGDLQQQDQQFKAGQLLDKYKFDNTQQLQRWIEENQTELARYGIDTNALVSRYQADQGLAAAGLGASASMYGAGAAADASRYNAMLDYQQGMAGIGANYGLGQDRLGYDYWNTGQNLGYNYWNSDQQRQQDNVFNQRGYDLGVYGLNRDVYGMDQAQQRYLMDLMWRMSPGGQMGGGYFPLPSPFPYGG